MSIVNKDNRQRLLANPHVESLTDKQIVYTEKFMLKALVDHESDLSAPQIWVNAGFELNWFKKGYFRKCIARWQSQCSGGNIRPQTRGAKVDVFDSLQEENSFLKAENALLKELRALGIKGAITGSILSLEQFRKIQIFQLPFCVESVELVNPDFISGLAAHIES